jgi:hypothetical protein
MLVLLLDRFAQRSESTLRRRPTPKPTIATKRGGWKADRPGTRLPDDYPAKESSVSQSQTPERPDTPPPDVPEPAPSPDPAPSPQPPPGTPNPGPGGEDEHPLETDYPDADDGEEPPG